LSLRCEQKYIPVTEQAYIEPGPLQFRVFGPNEKHPQMDRSAGAVIPAVPPKTVSLETNITGEN
jgi:hypothetical protein